ncbi:MAG: hypothetical protein FWH40_00005, partial [Coriobacteriia bacterium]|nr:hypothetical protein [Coriobacteriia bacterium]
GFADDVWCVYPGYAIFLLCGAMSLRIYPSELRPTVNLQHLAIIDAFLLAPGYRMLLILYNL